jgi:hypothetical protein
MLLFSNHVTLASSQICKISSVPLLVIVPFMLVNHLCPGKTISSLKNRIIRIINEYFLRIANIFTMLAYVHELLSLTSLLHATDSMIMHTPVLQKLNEILLSMRKVDEEAAKDVVIMFMVVTVTHLQDVTLIHCHKFHRPI